MGYLLFLLFLAIPLAEVALFIVVGGAIGVVATVAITVLTALAGAVLVRHQGLTTLARARREMDDDRIPAGALGEGLAILVAGAMLLTPGFFTDAIGFLLLVPPLRRLLVAIVAQWIVPRIIVSHRSRRPPHDRRRSPIIEGEAIEIEEPPTSQPDPHSPWRRR